MTGLWKDRTSVLKRGDEVTVEPHDKSFNDNVEVVEGSYLRHDNLCHRKWCRLAFLQVSNNK